MCNIRRGEGCRTLAPLTSFQGERKHVRSICTALGAPRHHAPSVSANPATVRWPIRLSPTSRLPSAHRRPRGGGAYRVAEEGQHKLAAPMDPTAARTCARIPARPSSARGRSGLPAIARQQVTAVQRRRRTVAARQVERGGARCVRAVPGRRAARRRGRRRGARQ